MTDNIPYNTGDCLSRCLCSALLPPLRLRKEKGGVNRGDSESLGEFCYRDDLYNLAAILTD